MTTFLLVLGVKSAIVLMAGVIASVCMRRAPAAVRHLVWVAVIGATLLLPLGLLVPTRMVLEPITIRIGSVERTSGAGRNPARLLTIMTRVWLLGSALLLARLASDGVRSIRLVRRSRSLVGSSACEIRISDQVSGPASWSFGCGAILLPRDAPEWTQGQFDAAVRHESAHIQRHDSLWLLLCELACAVYWFQPLVWYAARRLRIEQEHAADDLVLGTGLDPADYARQLVSLVRGCRREPLFAGVGTGSLIQQRVKAILDVRRRRRSMVTRKMFATALAAALMIALPLSALQTQRKVLKIGGDVSAPKLIYKLEPQYTPEARDAKIEGTVVLSVVIEDTGTISDVRVVRGLDEGLDRNAVEALQEWQFHPAEKNGEPVAVSANVEVNFRLQ